MFVCCILDTEHLYTEIIEGIVGQYGKTFTLDIKVKQMGRKEPEAAKVVIGMLQLQDTRNFVSTKAI